MKDLIIDISRIIAYTTKEQCLQTYCSECPLAREDDKCILQQLVSIRDNALLSLGEVK